MVTNVVIWILVCPKWSKLPLQILDEEIENFVKENKKFFTQRKPSKKSKTAATTHRRSKVGGTPWVLFEFERRFCKNVMTRLEILYCDLSNRAILGQLENVVKNIYPEGGTFAGTFGHMPFLLKNN